MGPATCAFHHSQTGVVTGAASDLSLLGLGLGGTAPAA
jgi:hypothetical protein